MSFVIFTDDRLVNLFDVSLFVWSSLRRILIVHIAVTSFVILLLILFIFTT